MPRDWVIIQSDTVHEINGADTAQHVVVNETLTWLLPISALPASVPRCCKDIKKLHISRNVRTLRGSGAPHGVNSSDSMVQW